MVICSLSMVFCHSRRGPIGHLAITRLLSLDKLAHHFESAFPIQPKVNTGRVPVIQTEELLELALQTGL